MISEGSPNRFTVWDYDTQTVIGYLREGECSGCGLCCQSRITFSVVRPIDQERLTNGGTATSGEGKWVEVTHRGKKRFFRMRDCDRSDVHCLHLEGTGNCSIYRERFLLCRVWPMSPSDNKSIPECAYRFKQIGEWSFDQIEKGS